MKRFRLMTLILVAMSLFLSASNVFAEYKDNVNLEIKLDVGNEEMLSGEQNYVSLKMKTTGAKTVFTDVVLTLTPSVSGIVEYNEDALVLLLADKFDSYAINDDGSLEIIASELPSGLFYDLPIQFMTKNGLTPDGSEISFSAHFSANETHGDESVSVDVTTEPTNLTVIEASSPLKINKKLLGTSASAIESKIMRYGTETYWLTRAAIDGAPIGQEFIQEGTKIVVTEIYDEHFVYNGMQDGYPEPNSVDEVTRTITWEFDAPSYAEQVTNIASGALWQQDLIVIYDTIEEPDGAEIVRELPVQVEMSFTNISNKTLSDSDAVLVDLYPNATYIPKLNGSWNVFGTWGPIDGLGNHGYASTADMNVNPTVYGDDTLTYAHRLSSMYNGKLSGYTSYIVNYFVDDYLDLSELKLPSEWVNFPDSQNGIRPIDYPPTYEILLLSARVDMDITLDDNVANVGDILIALKIGTDFSHGDTIDIRQVLLDAGYSEDTHVAQVQYVFKDTPPGMFSNTGAAGSNMFRYVFSISEDWKNSDKYDLTENRTRLKNDISIFALVDDTKTPLSDTSLVAEIWDFTEETIESENSSWLDLNNILVSKMYVNRLKDGTVRFNGFGQSLFWDVNGPRMAYVTDDPVAYEPTVTNKIELLEKVSGEVYLGPNQLQVTVTNHPQTSVGKISPQGLESYILVPNEIAVNLTGFTASHDAVVEKVTDYTNTLYKLYKISWLPESDEAILPGTELSIVFNVEINSGFSALRLHVYTDLLIDRAFNILTGGDALTDTIIVPNEIGLDYDEDYELLKSSNQYYLVDQYLVVTNKQVMGNLDTEFTTDGRMSLDGSTTYRLKFKNNVGKEISNLTLLDVLPSIGDLGITDGVSRGSEYGLVLDGPIDASQKFTIFYSTSKNPERDYLNNQLTLGGFIPITNPDNAEAATWVTEDQVTDWNQIHSFQIKLNADETLTVNEEFVFEFTTVVDSEDVAIFNELVKSYVAWNSFALTIDGYPIIEPLQVAVRIEHEFIEYTMNKIWVNGPDTKPEIQVQLLRNDESYGEPITLDGSENWTYTWTDLPKTDLVGNEYVYSIEEVNVPENYKKTVDGSTITNTYVSPKTEVTVDKVWVGGPEEKPVIQVQLYRNGEAYLDAVILDGSTSYTWTELDETDQNGVKYVYTVDEVAVPENYEKSVSGTVITNTYRIGEPPVKPVDPVNPETPNIPVVPELPKTGVSNDNIMYSVLIVLSGVILILVGKRRKINT